MFLPTLPIHAPISRFPRGVWLAALLVFGFASQLQAEKIWTNALSGYWRDGANWSGHTPPDVNSFLRITNDNTKTVTIDALTADTNLTVQMLTLSAPPGATNTLLLTGLGTNNPLVFQTGLELQDGAAMVITNSALLLQLTNDHVNIDGSLTLDTGSIDFGDLTVTARVGRVTSGVFTINGGTVSAGAVTVGGLTNSSGFLAQNGGTLNIASFLSVGRNPGTTGTVAILEGQLNVKNDDTRIGDSGVGFMTVSNATAWLLRLDVGRDPDSPGTLLVEAGAAVLVSSNVSIGRFNGGVGVVTVGGGRLVSPGQKLYLGQEGSGQLNISNGVVEAGSVWIAASSATNASGVLSMSGGSLSVSNLVVGSTLVSTGQVFLSGGTLTVTNAAANGSLSLANGSLTLSGGTLDVDNLLLTNASGQFTFAGGTLDTAGTSVANGAPFVVGDGSAPARLHLNGGTHFFANGLVISRNAILDGCGTIIGSVVNLGTIATNCDGTTSGTFAVALQDRVGTTNVIAFPSTLGSSYILQFKVQLSDPTWTDIPPATNGTGSLILLQDPVATGPTRFYRVRAQ